MTPCHPVSWLSPEEGVSHTVTIDGAELQQALPVFIANSKMPKARRPGVMASTDSGVEVSQDDDLFLGGMLFMVLLMLV